MSAPGRTRSALVFGWLRKKVKNAAVDSQRDDLTRFVESLRGQSSSELAALILVATVVRLTVDSRTLPIALLEGLSNNPDDLLSPVLLTRLIKDLQRQGSLPQAAGAMIWLHSARAILQPELRLLGRQMWAELVRGIPHVNDARLDLMSLTGQQIDPKYAVAAVYVPPPLTPFPD